jgi:hypothetical protein
LGERVREVTCLKCRCLSSSLPTSLLPLTSSSVAIPCVSRPTLQLPWSSGTVRKVRSAALTQNTHPAGTLPVRPSGVGGGIGSSKAAIPSGRRSEK